jgi:type II secretory pathway predicted ATPase ExeA
MGLAGLCKGGVGSVWKRYWKLSVDPFSGPAACYVPLAPHEEAVARLVDAIVSGRQRAILEGGAGLGKSVVLARALAQTRGPAQRTALVRAPGDGAALFAGLAERLGRRALPGAGRGTSWRALEEAVRLCRWQRLRVVLVIDDCQHLTARDDRLDLERLAHLDPHPESRVSILEAYRTDPELEFAPQGAAAPWEFQVRLAALTRSDVEAYLIAKLNAAGRDGPTFTPRAIHRLHAATAGNPRTLDRLATLVLMAGALRRVEIVAPDLVEAVSRECIPDPSLL